MIRVRFLFSASIPKRDNQYRALSGVTPISRDTSGRVFSLFMRFLLHPHGSRVNLTRDRHVHAIGKNDSFFEKTPLLGCMGRLYFGKSTARRLFSVQ